MEPAGEDDTALNPKSYSTVDPEVRAYVYSLVSAVCLCDISFRLV